jgi:hypothetical protein
MPRRIYTPTVLVDLPMFTLLFRCVDKAKPLAYNPSQLWSGSYLTDPSAGFRSGTRPNLAQSDDIYSAQ